jgi:hydroxymethylpyrimidine/phosphomethylpyrimidine kinase
MVAGVDPIVTAPERVVSVLTIAGSDSGGGAGIQADLKTFAAHGLHGLSAIAALTAQHTRGVTAVHTPDVGFLRAQIDACFDDFDVRAVKLGMLATADIIHAEADALTQWPATALVVDPVMVAKFRTTESMDRPTMTKTKVFGLVKTHFAVRRVRVRAFRQAFHMDSSRTFFGSTMRRVMHRQTRP